MPATLRILASQGAAMRKWVLGVGVAAVAIAVAAGRKRIAELLRQHGAGE
jgi:hypothetical protein